MRKSLMILLALGAVALFAVDSGAKELKPVVLTKDQVNTVCGNTTYCEKKCGLNGEHTCTFGCGPKSCSGMCKDCASRTVSVSTVRNVVRGVKGVQTRASRPQ
jgi:hypothetical protein